MTENPPKTNPTPEGKENRRNMKKMVLRDIIIVSISLIVGYLVGVIK